MGASSQRSETEVPDRIGRYDILMPIASGGMATVYLARAVGPSGFATEVALKLPHAHLSTSAEFASNLVEEGKLAARIRHRNVASVIDVGDGPTGLYLVMEYVEGDTLAGLTRGPGAIPTPMAARLLVDALAGLHAAHELRAEDGSLVGVVHRDFTPQNILVGTDGVARLTDFGIAKAATRIGHTRTGMVKGKISYMAPEQAHGIPLDRRCDVWAAGVVAWEIFAGRRLHGHEDELATLLKVATVRPPLLRSVAPDVPEAVEDAVAGALQMMVEDRHPTAQAFAKQLAAACRATLGIAEVDEIAAWMAAHVTTKVTGQRERLARARARRDELEATRVEGLAASGTTDTVADLQGEEVLSLHTVASGSRLAPTDVFPTVAVGHEARPLTDGVSVVGRRWRGSGSFGVGPRVLVAGGLFAALLVGATTVWRASASHGDARPADPQAGAAAASTSVATVAPPSSAVPTAATAAKLRLRANAAIASLRVNQRDVPLARPATIVDLDPSGFGPEPSLAIDAVATDGRRASIAVPTAAAGVTLEFPSRSTPGSPARPAVAPRTTTPAAPLAPSPYN